MGKYLKQGYVRRLEWEHSRKEISYSRMIELIEQECINNYKEDMKDKLNLVDGNHWTDKEKK